MIPQTKIIQRPIAVKETTLKYKGFSRLQFPMCTLMFPKMLQLPILQCVHILLFHNLSASLLPQVSRPLLRIASRKLKLLKTLDFPNCSDKFDIEPSPKMSAVGSAIPPNLQLPQSRRLLRNSVEQLAPFRSGRLPDLIAYIDDFQQCWIVCRVW